MAAVMVLEDYQFGSYQQPMESREEQSLKPTKSQGEGARPREEQLLGPTKSQGEVARPREKPTAREQHTARERPEESTARGQHAARERQEEPTAKDQHAAGCWLRHNLR